MAKLTIEIEQNEFDLYDYEVHLDGQLIADGGNWTTKDNAQEHAAVRAREYLEFRGFGGPHD